jgi:FtsP/CotA-like multicopper oxidase with cupredoxin domain
MLDTVDVPYGVFKKPGDTTGDQMIPGAVTLRMDFRDKNIIGEFPFHCHILASTKTAA